MGVEYHFEHLKIPPPARHIVYRALLWALRILLLKNTKVISSFIEFMLQQEKQRVSKEINKHTKCKCLRVIYMLKTGTEEMEQRFTKKVAHSHLINVVARRDIF